MKTDEELRAVIGELIDSPSPSTDIKRLTSDMTREELERVIFILWDFSWFAFRYAVKKLTEMKN